MLRVGLTGGLGAGKSTVAQMLAEFGAVVLQSDAIGRELMEPGQDVYQAVVARFGPGVLRTDGHLDRPALSRLVFEQSAIEDLNAIVHPAVIARQEELVRGMAANAVVVIESALIFETKHGGAGHGGQGGWRQRFDQIILVTAPEMVKIARFLERSGATNATCEALEAEARRRLAVQMPDEAKLAWCDYVLYNDGAVEGLRAQVERVWWELIALH